jgi:hypothetical protein
MRAYQFMSKTYNHIQHFVLETTEAAAFAALERRYPNEEFDLIATHVQGEPFYVCTD